MKHPAISSSLCKSRYKLLLLLIFLGVLSCLTTSCAITSQQRSKSWHQQYKHLDYTIPENNSFTESDYFIIFLVAARHHDYTDHHKLYETLNNYDGLWKRGNVGHSWVYLKGIQNGKTVILEGGQSLGSGKGQTGFSEGIKNLNKYGYADPSSSEKRNYRYEPNPIKHLWAERTDGFFQKGSGYLRSTFAAKVDLSKEKFEEILAFMDEDNYPYQNFSLPGNQCSSFLAKIADMAGLTLEHSVDMKIDPVFKVGDREYRLWTDPYYSKLKLSTPDVIERSLIQAVMEGRAEDALSWYRKH